MRRKEQGGGSRFEAVRDSLSRRAELPRGPRLRTKEEILERAREMGREAARKSQSNAPQETPKKSDEDA